MEMDCYAIEFPIQIAELRRILGFPINIKTSHLHDKEAYPSPVMDGVLLLLLLLLLPCKCELPGLGEGVMRTRQLFSREPVCGHVTGTLCPWKKYNHQEVFYRSFHFCVNYQLI